MKMGGQTAKESHDVTTNLAKVPKIPRITFEAKTLSSTKQVDRSTKNTSQDPRWRRTLRDKISVRQLGFCGRKGRFGANSRKGSQALRRKL